MIFWDTSALLRLVVQEPDSARFLPVLTISPTIVVWWASEVEAESAISRRERDGSLSSAAAEHARTALERILGRCAQVTPSTTLRATARRLLRTHPLRAADALQLAAALAWADARPQGHGFCSADNRQLEAAAAEGFVLLP